MKRRNAAFGVSLLAGITLFGLGTAKGVENTAYQASIGHWGEQGYEDPPKLRPKATS
jgi:hypothetical protein